MCWIKLHKCIYAHSAVWSCLSDILAWQLYNLRSYGFACGSAVGFRANSVELNHSSHKICWIQFSIWRKSMHAPIALVVGPVVIQIALLCATNVFKNYTSSIQVGNIEFNPSSVEFNSGTVEFNSTSRETMRAYILTLS